MKKIIFTSFIILSFFSINAQSVPPYIPTAGLIGWYPFTSNANDESGTGNNGIVIGASPTTDRFGSANSAYYFNGTTNHISIPTNFFNIGTNGFTVSCWINTSNLTNPNNNNHNQCIFNTRPHNGIALDFNWGSTNKYSLWVGSNPSSSGWNIFSDAVSTNNVVINTWNNMILVKNGSTYYLYINGVLDKTYTNSTVASNYLCKMVIGQTDSTVATETFFGKLDDFGMWSRALSTNEITQVFQSTLTSIKNNSTSNYIKIFPNPTNNFLTVDIGKTNQRIEIKIFNVIGEEIKNDFIDRDKTLIDVSGLNNGVYFITLINGKEIFTEKIIINK